MYKHLFCYKNNFSRSINQSFSRISRSEISRSVALVVQKLVVQSHQSLVHQLLCLQMFSRQLFGRQSFGRQSFGHQSFGRSILFSIYICKTKKHHVYYLGNYRLFGKVQIVCKILAVCYTVESRKKHKSMILYHAEVATWLNIMLQFISILFSQPCHLETCCNDLIIFLGTLSP